MVLSCSLVINLANDNNFRLDVKGCDSLPVSIVAPPEAVGKKKKRGP